MTNSKLPLRRDLSSMLASYLQQNPAELSGLNQLSEQLTTDAGDLFHRSNMRGHVTASALVLDPSFERVLMIHHPLHNKLLQPGGHVEDDCQALWEAAQTEAREETGLAFMKPILTLADPGLPIDIDTHAIAANPKKGEGAHFHHDLMFIAVATDDFKPTPAPGDTIKEARWISIADLAQLTDPRMARIFKKLEQVLAQQSLGSQAAPDSTSSLRRQVSP